MSEQNAEVGAACPRCSTPLHRLTERNFRCNLGHLIPSLPPGMES